MIEIIQDMQKKQKELDVAIMKNQGITYKDVSLEQYYYAILDEIGELNHELKYDWCWWKKTQTEVDKEKVLQELVDVWFFTLSVGNKLQIEYSEEIEYGYDTLPIYLDKLHRLLIDKNPNLSKVYDYVMLVDNLKNISIKTGFTMQEVYQGYMEKLKINYERIENNY